MTLLLLRDCCPPHWYSVLSWLSCIIHVLMTYADDTCHFMYHDALMTAVTLPVTVTLCHSSPFQKYHYLSDRLYFSVLACDRNRDCWLIYVVPLADTNLSTLTILGWHFLWLLCHFITCDLGLCLISLLSPFQWPIRPVSAISLLMTLSYWWPISCLQSQTWPRASSMMTHSQSGTMQIFLMPSIYCIQWLWYLFLSIIILNLTCILTLNSTSFGISHSFGNHLLTVQKAEMHIVSDDCMAGLVAVVCITFLSQRLKQEVFSSCLFHPLNHFKSLASNVPGLFISWYKSSWWLIVYSIVVVIIILRYTFDTLSHVLGIYVISTSTLILDTYVMQWYVIVDTWYLFDAVDCLRRYLDTLLLWYDNPRYRCAGNQINLEPVKWPACVWPAIPAAGAGWRRSLKRWGRNSAWKQLCNGWLRLLCFAQSEKQYSSMSDVTSWLFCILWHCYKPLWLFPLLSFYSGIHLFISLCLPLTSLTHLLSLLLSVSDLLSTSPDAEVYHAITNLAETSADCASLSYLCLSIYISWLHSSLLTCSSTRIKFWLSHYVG